ncbi:RTA1 like protein [Hyaloscypha variabilis F]|uniref:RTA1 like protein n=1 Tax=Hyaloscypha variabilis (strain UAMH 11265 / GT02V1 / F) TaxID=1149755 RepID=A0A2J6RZ10_HYAVF|nr:RTA1 like protein [Hyaloscypha variabilis F]
MAVTTDLYKYSPSVGAAVFFAILFGITTLIHTYQIIRTQTWFLIPFLVGGYFELGGYIARTLSAQETPNWTIGPFIIQQLLLLVAPALFAASIYMELGHIIQLVHGERRSIISRRWLTKIFVAGDIVSFLAQCAGSMAGSSQSAVHTGQTIILCGLVAQILSFLLFVHTAVIFHLRVRSRPTRKLLSEPAIPWQKHMFALYGGSVLILIRCVFRLVEYAGGRDGPIMSHEIFLYIFDSVLMWGTMVTFAVVHPSQVNALLIGDGAKAVRKVVSVYRIVVSGDLRETQTR